MTARLCLATLLALVVGVVGAHATLVFGELTLTPDPPQPGVPFEVVVTLEDPTVTPIEDALIALEFRVLPPGTDASPAPTDADAPPPLRAIDLVEIRPAVYRGEVDLPEATTYTVRVRDRTFEFEEATASLVVEVGGRTHGALPFILPPTQVGPRGLATWLLWLVGVPLVAGAVVTVLVLTSPRPERSDGAPVDRDGAARTRSRP